MLYTSVSSSSVDPMVVRARTVIPALRPFNAGRDLLAVMMRLTVTHSDGRVDRRLEVGHVVVLLVDRGRGGCGQFRKASGV